MTRCTNCGLPLSPTRTYTHCPRCGAALGNAAPPSPVATRAQQYEYPWGGAVQGGAPVVPGAPGAATPPFHAWEQPAMGVMGSPPPQTLPPTSGWGPADVLATPAPQTPQPPQAWLPQTETALQDLPAAGYAGGTSGQRRTSHTRLGFIASATCIGMAAILLLCVWFMSLHLTDNAASSSVNQQPGVTATASQAATHTASVTATTTPPLTVTALPGQGYIDHPQMASAVNPQTGQPTHVTTHFKPNQQIYVTFLLHPRGTAGAVCVYWYLDGKSVTNFAFAVRPYSQSGYSYAIYGQPGEGTVDLYWASTTQCTDKVLAQQVTFTVAMS